MYMKKQLEKLKKFWKLIFGRTGILVFLLLVQAVILFGGFALIDKSAWIVNYTIGLLAVIILIYILNARSNSSFKLMWIILILVVLIGLVIIFKSQLTSLVQTIFEKITSESAGI